MNTDAPETEPETERQDGSEALPRNQDYPHTTHDSSARRSAGYEESKNATHRDPAALPVVLRDLRNDQHEPNQIKPSQTKHTRKEERKERRREGGVREREGGRGRGVRT